MVCSMLRIRSVRARETEKFIAWRLQNVRDIRRSLQSSCHSSAKWKLLYRFDINRFMAVVISF